MFRRLVHYDEWSSVIAAAASIFFFQTSGRQFAFLRKKIWNQICAFMSKQNKVFWFFYLSHNFVLYGFSSQLICYI
jgi:hypothetical protein